jgi:ABC-type enterochelin transport system ATPase subunit
MENRGLDKVRKIAKKLGIKEEINISNAKNKRFSVRYNGKLINFGLWPYSGGTFIDHNNNDIRTAWRARHKKIMKNDKPAYLDRTSPEFYSWHLLW